MGDETYTYPWWVAKWWVPPLVWVIFGSAIVGVAWATGILRIFI